VRTRVNVDHTTIYRWVQRYAPETEKRLLLEAASNSYNQISKAQKMRACFVHCVLRWLT
jgi:transposase-like protein